MIEPNTEPTEVAPQDVQQTELPATASPEQDNFSQLLSDYEASIAKSEPENVAAGTDQVQSTELDQLLNQLNAPDPKIAALEGELSGVRGEVDRLRAEAHRAKEMEAFNDYSKSLQEQLPPWLPEDYARLKLEALAHDQTTALAFDYRNVDKAAAKAELMRAQLVLAAFQRANDPRIPQLTEYMNKLNIAINSQGILRQARLNILNEANKLAPPIDREATELKAEIAWNMKAARSKLTPLPPPDFGKMTDAEFHNWKRDNLGWV